MEKHLECRRALLVGAKGSSQMQFLRYFGPKEDPFFDVKESEEFPGVLYYGADVFLDTNGQAEIVLDATGEMLTGQHPFYTSEKMAAPEIPMQMPANQ